MASAKLTEALRKLGDAAAIPEAVLRIATAHGRNIRRLEGNNDDGDPVPAPGVTFDVEQDRALLSVQSIRRQVGSSYFVFVSDRNFGIQGRPDNVSLLRTSDPYEAMRVMGTNGANYDISPEKVVAQLKKWDAEFGLSFHGVGFDWLEAQFQRPPADMMSFANRVYKFCPDVVDQGTETVERLAGEMKRTNTLYLWWD